MHSAIRLFGLAVVVFGCHSEPLDVANVDLTRIQGKWFEIAKLPRPSQAGCTGTTAEYQLASTTRLLVVNECRQGNLQGPLERVTARAVVTDPSVPAKLSLDFGIAFGDYWIIETGDTYEYLVVGHPTRDYLWIMSRERTLPKTALDGILQRARSRGFPTGILEYTEQ